MATYIELFDLRSNDSLRNKVAVAVAVKADGIIGEASPTAARLQWAQDALASPGGQVSMAYNAVLAANKGATVAAITGSSDSAIQTNVDAAIDKFYP
jgi:hypothetical protein